jgi:carbonic anhydrase/acetyltransferase-like protein (isoleucine patch superfamily)
VGARVYVAPTAAVIGDVELGDDASVWFGAVVRGDYYPIRIGARSNIQDNSVVHITNGQSATTIGDDVTVGHMVMLHGCTVGNRCLIGMGSVILDDAVIGDDSFVAAGSLVAPGKVVPPRSFILGRPAKAVRAVEARDLEWIQHAAKVYVEYSRDFEGSLRKVR